MTLHWVDYLWILGYFLLVGYVGVVAARRRKRKVLNAVEEFLLAGRSLTLPMFVATLVATWYGAILGVGEFVYNAGIAEWFAFALPYYIAALLYAQVLAIPVRQGTARTIPEQLRQHYGAAPALVGAVLILILTLPVSYALSFGVLIEMFGDLPRWLAIALGTLFSVGYLVSGGFRAGVMTDLLQFALMYLGFACLTALVIAHWGSPIAMWEQLPLTHKQLPGPYSWQFLLVWYVIALQTFIDPAFHQRCAAVRDPSVAKKGIRIAVLFWFLFDLMTLTCGLYLRAYVPDLQDPLFAYPVLADMVLPVALKGLFVVAVLATIMSTLDSYGFISAMTLSYDILPPLMAKLRLQWSEVTITRFALGIVAILSIVFALLLPSVVQLIYYSSSIAVAGLLFPLLLSYARKPVMEPKTAKRAMIVGGAASGGWILLRYVVPDPATVVHSIEPMFVGLAAAAVILGIYRIRNKMERAEYAEQANADVDDS